MAATIKKTKKVSDFFKSIGIYFKSFAEAVAKGDVFVKLSLIWVGAGYARRKQFIRSLLVTVLQAAVIAYSVLIAPQYISKFHNLGEVQMEMVFDINTMKNIPNDYDDSFQILLFSVISIIIWIVFFFFWISNVINVYRSEERRVGKECL